MLKKYLMQEIPYLRVLGRNNGCLKPVTLFWTASGIEMNVKAKEVWVKVRSEYEVQSHGRYERCQDKRCKDTQGQHRSR